MGDVIRSFGHMVPRKAGTTIADGAVVVVGADDDSATLPSGAYSHAAILGVAHRQGGGSYAANDHMDVITCGVAACIAAATITRGQRVVVANSSGHVRPEASNQIGVAGVGVALGSAVSGERVPVLLLRAGAPQSVIIPMIASAAITAGVYVATSTTGKIATGGADPTSGVVGVALTAAAADGDTVMVLTHGDFVLTASGAISAGAHVTGAAAGAVKTQALGAGVNGMMVGVALADAAGGVVRVLVNPYMMQGA